MNKKILSDLWSRTMPVMALTSAMAFAALHAKADYVLGPLNPGFENGGADWNSGGPNDSGGSNSFENVGNGPSVYGTNCALMTADGSVNPSGGNDIRCNYFSLGPATAGSNSVSVDFDYNIINPFPNGDNIRIDVRFEDSNGNFLGEYLFHVGSDNNDVGGTGWHHFHGVAADPTLSAVNMDLRLTMNIFGDDIWSAGPVLFDNFSVSATPTIGVNDNGDFENTGVNWNSGGPNDSGGSNSFDNVGMNGPSIAGNNSVMMTADGSVNPSGGNDIRANNFWLGPATRGTNGVSVDFDYNIINAFPNGDQIRVGLRFEDGNGNFLGEYNFHPGTANNDVGGTGWHHFHGVAIDPTHSAVTADLRLSMNIFGDDIWSAGPVYFDNFVVKGTPLIGPNYNGNFEAGEANWNNGVNSVPGGYEAFYYGPGTNGLSAAGTNCVLMSADGSIAVPNGNDIRVNEFNIPTTSQPVTISFDYNILNPITTPNQIRVGLRFFDGGNNFVGEHNTYIGTPNGDVGAQGWKHLSETYSIPSGAVQSDIRVTMNIFGDDIWSNGPVLLDNFTVITGTNAVPTANNVLMGTITNLAVTRPAIANAPENPNNLLEYQILSTNEVPQRVGGIIESDGVLAYPTVSYFGQPAHGTVTAQGPYLTYVPNNNYVGSDSFPFAIGDGIGGLATGTATVHVNGNIGANRFTGTAATGVVSFSGAADCDYVLDETYSLTPPVVWIPVLTNSASGSGSVTFTNQLTAPAGFWRTTLLP
ncbi:MAG TPA: Ig-like domain-containing protein [Candidatus Acidoferrales bacterium]|nr:Ig-like domain-containing protein [Candidatus Acidoferrales bacterium]